MKPSDESGASRAADVVPNSKSSSARAGVESVDHSSRRSGTAELPPPAWSDTIHCSSTCSPLTRSRCVGRTSKNSFDTTMAPPPPPAISDSLGSMELHQATSHPASVKGFNRSRCLRSSPSPCLLYTFDAADDLLCVDLGGRRIIKKKTH